MTLIPNTPTPLSYFLGLSSREMGVHAALLNESRSCLMRVIYRAG